MVINPKERANRMFTRLDEILSEQKEAIDNMENASNSELRNIIKDVQKTLREETMAFGEALTNLNTSDEIGGVYRLKVVSSKGREVYFVEGFEDCFYVESELKLVPEDPEKAVKMYNVYVPFVDTSLGHDTLTEALVEALFIYIDDDRRLSHKLDALKNSSLIPMVREKLRLADLKKQKH